MPFIIVIISMKFCSRKLLNSRVSFFVFLKFPFDHSRLLLQIHIVTGPLYLICWPLFGEDGRYFAVVVPALLTVKVGLVGTGLLHDPETVFCLSRHYHPCNVII
jgi:hypothetical protein